MEKRVRTFIAAHTSSQGDATLDATISGRRHGCAIRVLSWPWLTPVMSCATLRLWCATARGRLPQGASGEIGWRHADWSNFRNGAKSALLSPRGTGKTSHVRNRSRTHRWVHSHSPTVSCAYRAAGWRQALPTRSPSIPSSARAAAPACRRAEALEVRYRAAVGVGEEAHSRQTRQRHSTGAHGRNR